MINLQDKLDAFFSEKTDEDWDDLQRRCGNIVQPKWVSDCNYYSVITWTVDLTKFDEFEVIGIMKEYIEVNYRYPGDGYHATVHSIKVDGNVLTASYNESIGDPENV
jgi:hypothetical protein